MKDIRKMKEYKKLKKVSGKFCTVNKNQEVYETLYNLKDLMEALMAFVDRVSEEYEAGK